MKKYNFLKYNHINRWNSFYYQIKEILNLNPKTVLEIGLGSGILKGILIKEGIEYYSGDFNKELNPDFLIDVKKMDLKKKFDLVVAFQVLEHLEYKYFTKSIENMLKHTNKKVIISLPYFGPYLDIRLKLFPFINLNIFKKFNYPNKLKHDEHFWEIGRKNYPIKKIIKDISKVANIDKRYICKEYPYHYFFILSEIKN